MPGPTHHYGGLAPDNHASSKHQGIVSHPKQAALQLLELAKKLMELGVAVAILPPQLRPYLPELKKHFSGDDEAVIAQAAQQNPRLLEAMSSSASMWAANSATVSCALDTSDHKTHITIANLHTNLHRRIEALTSYRVFRNIFARVPRVVVDMPLDAHYGFRDEGAANHMRLAPHHSAPGLNVMVYGTDDNPRDPRTARQTLSASQEIIRKHTLSDEAAIVIKQNPRAIEQGVFHNDVIAVSNENLLLVHEEAFALARADIDFIADSYAARTGFALNICIIASKHLSITEAVNTYFFNSQIITLPDGKMAMIAPQEAKELYDGKAAKIISSMLADGRNPISQVHYVNLRESMQNGGGPACLRLRVPLDAEQFAALSNHTKVIMDGARLQQLQHTIEQHYPNNLTANDINDALYQRSKDTLKAFSEDLGLTLLD